MHFRFIYADCPAEKVLHWRRVPVTWSRACANNKRRMPWATFESDESITLPSASNRALFVDTRARVKRARRRCRHQHNCAATLWHVYIIRANVIEVSHLVGVSHKLPLNELRQICSKCHNREGNIQLRLGRASKAIAGMCSPFTGVQLRRELRNQLVNMRIPGLRDCAIIIIIIIGISRQAEILSDRKVDQIKWLEGG